MLYAVGTAGVLIDVLVPLIDVLDLLSLAFTH